MTPCNRLLLGAVGRTAAATEPVLQQYDADSTAQSSACASLVGVVHKRLHHAMNLSGVAVQHKPGAGWCVVLAASVLWAHSGGRPAALPEWLF